MTALSVTRVRVMEEIDLGGDLVTVKNSCLGVKWLERKENLP
jgi:hypothetical protein